MSNSPKITKILPPEDVPLAPQNVAPVVKPRFVAAPPTPTPSPVAASSVVTPKSRRWVWAGAGVAALVVAVVGGSYGAYSSWNAQQRIAPGLIIQGVPVGGLTRSEAKVRLMRKFGDTNVVFDTPKKPYTISLKQLGGEIQFDRALESAYWFGRSGALPTKVWRVWDSRSKPRPVALSIQWDKPTLRREMSSIAAAFREEAVPARLEMGDGGLQVVPDEPGRTINAGATLTTLQKSYFVGTIKPIRATIKPVVATVRAADLAGRDVELGHYTTDFNSGLWGRTRNLHIAVTSIDGRVFMPGEEFSFNKCTGERTWDKGYRMGHIFERKPGAAKAEVVEGLAGGVCQVSTTTFNAVRRTNSNISGHLKIVERNFHSLPVTYVSPGLDATVAWPDKDFRFVNTLEYPVYLRAAIEGERLRVSVWGRIPDNVPSPVQIAQKSKTSSHEL